MWSDSNQIPTTELRLRFCVLLVVLLALMLYDAPADPLFSVCGWKWLTGRPCPFCGLTRALCALAKGRWSAAIEFNMFSPLVFAALVALWWKYGSELLRRTLPHPASADAANRG